MISSNVQQSDSVSYEDMMVQIDFEYLEIAQIIKTSYSDLYAFDCDVFYELINKVKDLKVITLTDYNEQYLKDSEITVNYKVYSYYDRGFTDTTNYVIQYLNNIGYGRPNAIVYFKLKDKPITNKFHRFLVKVQLNDNSELNDTSEFVYITE